MGLFGRRKPRPTVEEVISVEALLLGDDLDRGDLDLVEVVGESFYQDGISAACGRSENEAVEFECVAALVADPDNEHDRNAIKVHVNGHHVGHLSREDAVRYHRVVDAAGELRLLIACNAYISARDPSEATTPNAGVFLHLPSPDRAAAELADYANTTANSRS